MRIRSRQLAVGLAAFLILTGSPTRTDAGAGQPASR